MNFDWIQKIIDGRSKGTWLNGRHVQRNGDVIAKRGLHGQLIAENCTEPDADYIAAMSVVDQLLLDVVKAAELMRPYLVDMRRTRSEELLKVLEALHAARDEVGGE